MIRQPSSVIVAGPSGSGKSELMEQWLRYLNVFKSNPKPWCMRITDGNPGSTVCKNRMAFDFIAVYRTPVI